MPNPAAPAIRWYRTPIDREEMRQILKKSNLLGALQTLAFLSIIVCTGGAVIWAASQGMWWAILPLLFVHGTCMHFLINAVHELGHETVFTNRAVNRFLAGFFAFPGWIHHLHFAESHGRHHRYTLHQPHDLEVTLPEKRSWRDFWRYGIVNLGRPRWMVMDAWKFARGRFAGAWNEAMFPKEQPELRRPIVRWAWTLLIGHALILGVSLWMHWWVVPLVVTFPTIFGGWLHYLVNSTQHVGLQDQVPDARLCCRTILINPFLRVLYWHMNFYIEHHMFAAVPCYRLARLHRAMRDDLPPSPIGLVATWRHIMEIMRKQAADPTYFYRAPLPERRRGTGASAPETVSQLAYLT